MRLLPPGDTSEPRRCVRRRTALRPLVGAALVAVLAGLLLVPVAPTARAGSSGGSPDRTERSGHHRPMTSRTLRVVTHNIAGGVIGHGDPRMLDRLDAEIARARPQVVMAQEVCSRQAEAFRQAHPRWTVIYTEMRPDSVECDSVGEMLATPRPVLATTTTQIGERLYARDFHLTCATIRLVGRRADACVTHVLPKWADDDGTRRADAIATIAGLLRERVAAGRLTVFGGDLNVGYPSPATRPLRRFLTETDPRHQPTSSTRSKLDYLWYGGAPVVATRAVVTPSVSDHRSLRGLLTYRTPALR